VFGHVLPQLFKTSVVVISDVAVGLTKLFRYFGERKTFEKMQSQRLSLIFR
jgi:hypothetical protein